MKTKIKPDERVQHVMVNQDLLHLLLRDGRHLIVPLEWFPRLQTASPVQRENWEIIGGGFVVRWPEIDEDLEITGLLAGNAAPERRDATSIEAAQIRDYRHRANLSQAELAEQLGVRQATVSDWEKGKSVPSPLASGRLVDAMRKLELAAESKVETIAYPTGSWQLAVGPAARMFFLDAGSQRFLEKCRYLDSGAGGAMLLLEECSFTDLATNLSRGIMGPAAPSRFNPVNRLTESWALSPT